MFHLRLPDRYVWIKGFLLIYLLPAGIINVGNVAAYLFQVVIGRGLVLQEFGTFNALLSVVLIVSAPANVLPLLVTQLALPLVGNKGMEREFAMRCLEWAAVVGALLLVISGVALYPLSEMFSVSRAAMTAAMLTVIASLFQPITVGLAQVRRRYVAAAVVQGANPILRFAFGTVLVLRLAGGVAGAMASVALPVILSFLIGLAFLRDLWQTPRTPMPTHIGCTLRRNILLQGASVTAFAALSNLDVVLAKSLLPPAESGLYAGAAVIGRIALLMPSALAGVIFSESARYHASITGTARRSAWAGVGLTALLAAPVALVFLGFGPFIATLLLGPHFTQAGDVLRLTGFSMALLSLTQAAAMVLAGRASFHYVWLLIGATASLAGLAPLMVGTAWGLAILVAVINVGLVFGLALGLARHTMLNQ